MNINPEYTIDYYDAIKDKIDLLSPAERTELEFKLVEEFNKGATEHQKNAVLAWMNASLKERNMDQGTAARQLGIDRTRLNRWLTGAIDPQLIPVLNFYVNFGGRNASDHPLCELGILNLGGFLHMLVFLRSWLEEGGSVKMGEISFGPPTLETFLALHYYFATTAPQDAFDANADIGEEIANILSRIAELIPKAERKITDQADFQQTMAHWGLPWLYGLTLMAETELGVEEFRVAAKRHVTISNSK